MTTAISSAPVAIAAPAPNLSVSHISLMNRQYGPRIHMDENAVAGSDPGGPVESMNLPADAPATFNSPSSAASFLASHRYNKAKAAIAADNPPPAESADPATAEHELAQANGEPAEKQPIIEEPKDAEPEVEKLPPIERPRSWSKDDDDDWKAIPRARQERIAASEQAREKDIRQRINDAAEKSKAVTAKEQQAEQVRTQYEGKLKSVVDVLEKEQLREFPDIRSMDDIEKMTMDMTRLSDPNSPDADPFKALQLQGRLRAWDFHQQKLAAAHNELLQAESRKATESHTKRAAYESEQRAKLSEMIPELANDTKFSETWKRAMPALDAIGISKETLARWADTEPGYEILLSAGFQKLVSDSLKLADIQAATAKAAPKPVPPVQRPGITPPRGAQDSENIQALKTKLNNSGSLKDAIALRVAQSKSRA